MSLSKQATGRSSCKGIELSTVRSEMKHNRAVTNASLQHVLFAAALKRNRSSKQDHDKSYLNYSSAVSCGLQKEQQTIPTGNSGRRLSLNDVDGAFKNSVRRILLKKETGSSAPEGLLCTGSLRDVVDTAFSDGINDRITTARWSAETAKVLQESRMKTDDDNAGLPIAEPSSKIFSSVSSKSDSREDSRKNQIKRRKSCSFILEQSKAREQKKTAIEAMNEAAGYFKELVQTIKDMEERHKKEISDLQGTLKEQDNQIVNLENLLSKENRAIGTCHSYTIKIPKERDHDDYTVDLSSLGQQTWEDSDSDDNDSIDDDDNSIQAHRGFKYNDNDDDGEKNQFMKMKIEEETNDDYTVSFPIVDDDRETALMKNTNNNYFKDSGFITARRIDGNKSPSLSSLANSMDQALCLESLSDIFVDDTDSD